MYPPTAKAVTENDHAAGPAQSGGDGSESDPYIVVAWGMELPDGTATAFSRSAYGRATTYVCESVDALAARYGRLTGSELAWLDEDEDDEACPPLAGTDALAQSGIAN